MQRFQNSDSPARLCLLNYVSAFGFWVGLIMLFLGLSSASMAQQRVDPHFTYFRVYCVVPLVGTGGANDPVRPDYIPVPSSTEALAAVHDRSGILAFYSETSDDGRWALAEIVSRDRASLAPILADKRPGVWAVEKGSVPRSEILAVFQHLKKNINLEHFGVAVR